MSRGVDLQALIDLWGTIQHFGERPVVQKQLAFLILILPIVWLVSRLVWRFAGRRAQDWAIARVSQSSRRQLEYLFAVVQYSSFPLLSLALLTGISRVFQARSWHAGIVEQLILLTWVILAYRMFLGISYVRLGAKAMRRYHYRFIGPLISLAICAWMLDQMIPLSRLAEIKLWDGFTSPITLEALLIATIGFYFWYDGSGVVYDLLYSALVPRTSVETGTIEASLTIGRYILIAVGLLIVVTVLGFDSTMLAYFTGALTVGIGFGSKEIIGNMISGVLLLFDNSLRPGDIISIEGQMGVVKGIGVRATTVNTLNNVEVVIPNQTFLTSSVTTYTKTDRVVRILVPVETADKHTPNDVRDALLSAAHKHPHVAAEPEPVVFFLGNGDTSHRFQLAVWFDDPTRTMALTSELYFNIFGEFSKRGIGPSTPQRNLQILNEQAARQADALASSSVRRWRPIPNYHRRFNQ